MKARVVQRELWQRFGEASCTVRKRGEREFLIQPNPAVLPFEGAEQIMGWAQDLADFEDFKFELVPGHFRSVRMWLPGGDQ